jgi:hypothetical protein
LESAATIIETIIIFFLFLEQPFVPALMAANLS